MALSPGLACAAAMERASASRSLAKAAPSLAKPRRGCERGTRPSASARVAALAAARPEVAGIEEPGLLPARARSRSGRRSDQKSMSPPWPWPPAGMASFFSGMSVTSVSVVRTMAAMEAAFWRAERVTLAASTMPLPNMSP